MRYKHPTLDDITQTQQNLLAAIAHSKQSGLYSDGLDWYNRARSELSQIAQDYGVPVWQSAAIAAILSPGCKWTQTLQDTKIVIESCRDYGMFPVGAAAYHANIRKAINVLAFHDASYVRGRKVHAFYRALMGDSSQVVIDTWMLRLTSYSANKPVHGASYGVVAHRAARQGLKIVADTLNLSVAQCQAVAWLSIIDLWDSVRAYANGNGFSLALALRGDSK